MFVIDYHWLNAFQLFKKMHLCEWQWDKFVWIYAWFHSRKVHKTFVKIILLRAMAYFKNECFLSLFSDVSWLMRNFTRKNFYYVSTESLLSTYQKVLYQCLCFVLVWSLKDPLKSNHKHIKECYYCQKINFSIMRNIFESHNSFLFN